MSYPTAVNASTTQTNEKVQGGAPATAVGANAVNASTTQADAEVQGDAPAIEPSASTIESPNGPGTPAGQEG